MKEGREKINPQEKLASLIESYRQLKKENKRIEAELKLKEAIDLANAELLDTSRYADIPELQESTRLFSSKEEKAEFYEKLAQEFETKGDLKLAKAYKDAAAELRREIEN